MTKAGNTKKINEKKEIEEQIKLLYNEWKLQKETGGVSELSDIVETNLKNIYGSSNVSIRKYNEKYYIGISKNNNNYEFLLKVNGNIIDKIPDGYTECEYLESTGSQFIDTNTKYYDIGKIEMSFLATELTVPLFGENIYLGEVMLFYKDSRGYLMYINGRGYEYSEPTVNERYNVFFDITNGNASLVINDQLIGTSTGNSNSSDSYKLKLFYRNHERFFNFRCTDNNGNPMFDFVPCLDNNGTPCMYDIITETSFYNAGQGQFLYKCIE